MFLPVILLALIGGFTGIFAGSRRQTPENLAVPLIIIGYFTAYVAMLFLVFFWPVAD